MSERACVVCGELLTGRQATYCSGQHARWASAKGVQGAREYYRAIHDEARRCWNPDCRASLAGKPINAVTCDAACRVAHHRAKALLWQPLVAALEQARCNGFAAFSGDLDPNPAETLALHLDTGLGRQEGRPARRPRGWTLRPGWVGMRGNESERFWAKVEKSDGGCWLWTASINGPGYGQFWSAAEHRIVGAHRWAFVDAYGSVSDGLEVVQTCGERLCVNPEHLRAVAPATRTLNARKTHCAHGHKFDEENTYVDRRGRRHCIACRNERQRQLYANDPERREARAAYAREWRRRKAGEREAAPA